MYERIQPVLAADSSQFSTPCYVYSVSAVEESFKALKDALGTQVIYSVKSNANTDLMVRTAHVLTDGAEVASIQELHLVASGSCEKYVNNPSADKNFLRAAIASKANIILDNIPQVKLVAEISGGKRPIQGVLLRLNSIVLNRFNTEHPKVREDQFGMDWETAKEAIALCKEYNLPLKGFHVFKGSYSFEKTAFPTVDAAKNIIAEMESIWGAPLSFANLGGGFGEEWRQSKFDFAAYREKLKELPEHIQIAHETGRGLMAKVGFFLTRVRYVKSIESKNYAICDGGIAQSFLLAQTENTFRKLKAPTLFQASPSEETASCSYVGSSCSKDDVIGRQGEDAPKPQPGDICVYSNCGAYNASYTVSPFLLLQAPKTYIID